MTETVDNGSLEAVNTEPVDIEVADGIDNKEWFVIHTYSGYENKVKANLEKEWSP